MSKIALIAAFLIAFAAFSTPAEAFHICPKRPVTCMTKGGDSPGYVLAEACFEVATLSCQLCSTDSPVSLCSQTYPVCKGGNCKGCLTIPRGMRDYVKMCCDRAGVCVEEEY